MISKTLTGELNLGRYQSTPILDYKSSYDENVDLVNEFAKNIYNRGFLNGQQSKQKSGDPRMLGTPNINFSLDVVDDPGHKDYDLWTKQRSEQGFDETEIWNLGVTIAMFVKPRLQYYRDHHTGYPGGMTDEEWTAKLDKMLETLDKIITDTTIPDSFTKEDVDQWNKDVSELSELFSIWD